MNWTKHLATAAAVIGLTATAFSVQAQTLRLAVTDIVGLENLQREYAGFQKILSEKSGMKVELFPVPNRTAAVEALNAKKIDLVLTGPGAMSDGIQQGLWVDVWKSHAKHLPKPEEVYHEQALMMQRNFGRNEGVAVV